MSIALAERIKKFEEKLAALEAAFLRPQECGQCSCKPDLEKMKNDIQGLKMRMGKGK